MNLLVGIPVFRIQFLVRACLNSLIDTPATVLVVDNGSDPDIKDLIREYSSRIKVITNEINGYCNGGWNQTMDYALRNGFDTVGLGSSDVVMQQGWHEILKKRLTAHTDEVVLPQVGGPPCFNDPEAITNLTGGVAGYFSFLPIKAVQKVYPIPHGIRHWFGDEYIFTKLRANGWKVVEMRDLRAMHQQSAVTAATPEAYAVIEQDKKAWQDLGGTI